MFDITGHTPSLPAPVIDRRHIDYLLHNPHAAVLYDLTDGGVHLHTTRTDPFALDESLVLVTYDDVMARITEAMRRGGRKPSSAAIAKAINLDHFAMHARGEFPSLDELHDLLAEVAVVLPFSKGA